MEWREIELLYPESFKRFVTKMFPNVGVISISTLEFFDIKKLYGFFDEEGIYLTIERYNKNQWVSTISLSNGIVFGPAKESRRTREETEQDGFTECFKVLDFKLKQKNEKYL
jgi:hypothetical protein